jgi:hypothetical protein
VTRPLQIEVRVHLYNLSDGLDSSECEGGARDQGLATWPSVAPSNRVGQPADSDSSNIRQITLGLRVDLPPAKDFAKVWGVNTHTVLRAFHQLLEEGILEFQRGRQSEGRC